MELRANARDRLRQAKRLHRGRHHVKPKAGDADALANPGKRLFSCCAGLLLTNGHILKPALELLMHLRTVGFPHGLGDG